MTYLMGHEPRITLEDILDELQKARTKFPANPVANNEDLLAMLAALSEEVGELNQAVIQFLYEPNKNKTYEDIRKEAIQVGAMAMRVLLDTKLVEHNPHGVGQR